MIDLGAMQGRLLGGVEIRTDPTLTHWVEDWSDVRSPGRAARRRKRGFKQRIVTRKEPKPDVYRIGNMLVMHPETWRRMERSMETQPKKGTP